MGQSTRSQEPWLESLVPESGPRPITHPPEAQEHPEPFLATVPVPRRPPPSHSCLGYPLAVSLCPLMDASFADPENDPVKEKV